MIDASWVIVDRDTSKAVMETYNFELCQFVNLNRYRVVPILQWLQSLNKPTLPDFTHLPYAQWAELQAAHYSAQEVNS